MLLTREAGAQMLEAPVSEPFSRETLLARASLLEGLAASLSAASRASRPVGGHGGGATASACLLPRSQAVAALSLLLETGAPPDAQAALSALEQLRGGALSPAARRDAHLVAALARSLLAREALAGVTPSPAAASAQLRLAAEELGRAGAPPLAPRLAADLEASLEALQPAALAEALRCDHPASRAAAIASLRQLTARRDASVGAAYLAELFPSLACSEAADLADWAGAVAAGGERHPLWSLLRTGLQAELASALSLRDPGRAKKLAQAHALTAPQWGCERAAAAMLLGEPKRAMDALTAAAAALPDGEAALALRTVQAGIQGASSAGEDIEGATLAGLCGWAEEWMVGGPLSEWRDSRGTSALLVPYFSDARVAKALGGGALASSLSSLWGWFGRLATPALPAPDAPLMLPPPQAAPPSAAARAAAAVASDKAGVVRASVRTQPAEAPRPQYVPPVREAPPEASPAAPPARKPIRTAVPTAMPQRAIAPWPRQPPPPPQPEDAARAPQLSYGELMRRKRQSGAAPAAAAEAATGPVVPKKGQMQPDEPEEAVPLRARAARRVDTDGATTREQPAVVSSAEQLRPAQEAPPMSPPPSPPPPRAPRPPRAAPPPPMLRPVAASLLLAASLGAAAALLRARVAPPSPPPPPTTSHAPAQRSAYASMSSARDAERLIREWQRAKAVAMGSGHDSGALRRVVAGAMLDEWDARSQRAKEADFHWRFALREARVTRLVGGTPPGAPAAAEATLREKATLVDARGGAKVDQYDATYKVRYLLEDRGEGYKISRAAVLDSTDAKV